MTNLTQKQATVADLAEVMTALGMEPFSPAKIRKMSFGVVCANLAAYRLQLAERNGDAAPAEAPAQMELIAMETPAEGEAIPAEADLGFTPPAEAPTAEDEAAYEIQLQDEEPAIEIEAEEEPTEEEIRDFLKGQFALYFMNAGGNAPRGICKALRAIATSWDGSRKEFLNAAEDNGLNRANAAAEWQTARKR